MASPRWITAAEVTQDEAGDVQGPTSATDGNLAVFDGTTGKLIKDGGAVPGGGGQSVKVIDLGVLEAAEIGTVGLVELIAYTAGRTILSVGFWPDNYFGGPGDDSTQIWFVTGSTATIEGSSGYGRFGGQNEPWPKDTQTYAYLGLLVGMDGIASSGGQSTAVLVDNTPLYAVHNSASGNAYGNGLNTYLPFRQWSAETVFIGGELIPANGAIWHCEQSGTSGSSEPDWASEPGGGTLSDGTTAWAVFAGAESGVDMPASTAHAFAVVIDQEPASDIPIPTSIEWVVQPTDAVAEATVTPALQLRIKDQNDDPYLFPADHAGMQLFIAGPGTLNGTVQKILVSDFDLETGIVTFDDLTITEPGEGYILRAYGYGLVNVPYVDSDPFDITVP